MLPAFATVADLEARLGLAIGSLTGPERARAQAALDDASALVRAEARRTWVVITQDIDGNDVYTLTDVPDVIVRVTLGAALRNFQNPDDRVISETVGPFSRTLRYSEHGVYLTDAELAIIRRWRPSRGGLWTLPTYRDDAFDTTLFMEDTYGCELFPVGSSDDPLA
jgi:hypothetical protein